MWKWEFSTIFRKSKTVVGFQSFETETKMATVTDSCFHQEASEANPSKIQFSELMKKY